MRVHRDSRRVVTFRPLVLAVVLVLSALGAVTPAVAQDETGTVVIAKHACPLDFDAYTATPDELKETCPLAEAFPPVTFDIDYGDGRIESVETKAALVMLMDVPTGGTMTLAEVLPAGMGEPVVYCSAKAGGAVTMEPTLVPVMDGNAVEIEPRAGETLSCFWFNVFGGSAASGDDAETVIEATPASPAAVEGVTVEITVHGCAPGFDPGSSAEQFMEECSGHPVALLSAGDFDDYYEADTTPGVAGDNRVTFSGIPATGLTLSHLRPQSATTLAVFCAAGDSAALEPMAVTGWGSFDREMTGSESLACHWFTDGGDVEGDTSGNTVEIRAWTCVAGTEAGNDQWSYYYDQCEQADTATAFSLVSDAGEQAATLAGAGDWSTWTGVGTAFTIQATVPEGFGAPVIVCGAYEGNRVAIEWPVATGGAFDVGFDAESGQIMTCDWFNLPASSTS